MTTGYSGTYAVNATDVCPETARWIPKDRLGIDGDGHPIYPAVKDFEMSWGLIPISDFYTLYQSYLLVSNTGTITVDLPEWGASDFKFRRYSGCIVHEPETGEFFTDHITNVRLLVTKIRV